MLQRNNFCSTVSRSGFYGTLWAMVLRPQGLRLSTKAQASSGLVSSTLYKFQSILRYLFGKTPQELRQRIASQATIRHATQSNVSLRSPFISKLVTGSRKLTLSESYFRHSQRFRAVNKRYLINKAGFSFALVGFYARANGNGNSVLDSELNDDGNGVDNGLPVVSNRQPNVDNAPGRISTWQKAFNIVKNHHFQLQELRDDIDSVEKIDFKDKISKGCNGVVYRAEIGPSRAETCPLSAEAQSGQKAPETAQKVAVKMLFNFDTASDSALIINSFIKETLPYRGGFGTEILPVQGRKSLAAHPNIVKILSVFAADFKLLSGCSDYPKALPAKFGGYGRNMTLFIVERLYDMSLKDYLLQVPKPKANHSLGMLCQLLDGVDFLHRNQVAHRDLKPDNVLVKLCDRREMPWLVITDFGLASTALKLPYTCEEIGKGGNLALMAPEIKNAVAGPNRFLDYCRSDVWAVGAIAYELFGGSNPFYRQFPGDEYVNSGRYLERNLPEFPSECRMLKGLIRSILSVDPLERPSPSFASTFCHLLLYMGAKNLRRLSSMKNDRIRVAITHHWWSAFTSELITQTWNATKQTLTPNEHQLRVHFVTNVNANMIVQTVNDCRFYVE